MSPRYATSDSLVARLEHQIAAATAAFADRAADAHAHAADVAARTEAAKSNVASLQHQHQHQNQHGGGGGGGFFDTMFGGGESNDGDSHHAQARRPKQYAFESIICLLAF